MIRWRTGASLKVSEKFRCRCKCLQTIPILVVRRCEPPLSRSAQCQWAAKMMFRKSSEIPLVALTSGDEFHLVLFLWCRSREGRFTAKVDSAIERWNNVLDSKLLKVSRDLIRAMSRHGFPRRRKYSNMCYDHPTSNRWVYTISAMLTSTWPILVNPIGTNGS